MILQILIPLFERDLRKLYTEIESYPDEESLWVIHGQIKNPGGNLCLHLLGNLNTYIGRALGGSGYIRNREAEFTQRNISRTELLDRIRETSEYVLATLGKLSESELGLEYPERVFEEKMTTGYFLVHLLAHLNYHTGQLNYHRRLTGTFL